MNKKDFQKKFPDVMLQQLTTAFVFSRAKVEETVLKLIKGLDTGLVYYEYDSKTIKVFTSDTFKNCLDGLKKGDQVLNQNTGIVGTVISEVPFLISGSLCIRVDFDGNVDAYNCDFFM
jgi:hypothetical protein